MKSFSDLNDENKEIVKSFLEKIDFEDGNLYFAYGISAQKKTSDIVARLNNSIMLTENERVNAMVGDVLERYVNKGTEKKGVFDFLKKNKVQEQSVEAQEKAILYVKNEIKVLIKTLITQNVVLGNLGEENNSNMERLDNLIIAGDLKILDAEKNMLTDENNIERFSKRVDELKLNKTMATQLNVKLEILEESTKNILSNSQQNLEKLNSYL